MGNEMLLVYVYILHANKADYALLYRKMKEIGCSHELYDGERKLKLPKGLYRYSGDIDSTEGVFNLVRSNLVVFNDFDVIVMSCKFWYGDLRLT